MVNAVFQYKAPAKINFRLKVTGRRADGYHLLSMLNGLISLYDTITISLTDNVGISVETYSSVGLERDPALDDPAVNLAARAATLVLKQAGVSAGIHIGIDKHIPSGGGLGGGSSNAGCVLKVLPRVLLDTGYIERTTYEELNSSLADRALSLGADVPFFLKHQSYISHVAGIGEVVEALETEGLASLPVYLLLPSFSLSTRSVFERYATITNKQTVFYEDFQSPEVLDCSGLFRLIENDLETAAVQEQPAIGTLIAQGRRLSGFVFGMTGSGSTLFAIPLAGSFTKKNELEELKKAFSVQTLQIIRTNLLAKPAY